MNNYFTFDTPAFRLKFPEFSDENIYPDAVLQGYWDMAICYMGNNNYGRLNGDCKFLALNLLTAHITKYYTTASGNGYQSINYIPTSAAIDKVSVSLTPPPSTSQWQWILNTTPYGQKYLQLLQSKASGGFIIITNPPERNAFRKNYGYFGG